jgi:hypothetical protein
MAHIVQIAVSPRKSTTSKAFDCVYVLTQDGEVWRADLQQGSERTMEWTKLPDLPSQTTTLPAPE